MAFDDPRGRNSADVGIDPGESEILEIHNLVKG